MKLYIITNRVNGKRYVGITSRSIKERWLEHVQAASAGDRRALCCAIRKYGKESFDIQVASSAETWDELCAKERDFISALSTICPAGYNMTSGGDGVNGLPPEIIERIAKGNRGRRHSEDAIMKIGLARMGHEVTPETKEKMSKAHKGKVLTKEHRDKLSAAKLGKKLKARSLDHSAKISEGLKRSWKRRKGIENE